MADEATRAKWREATRRYRRTVAGRAAAIAYRKKWAAENPERVAELNRNWLSANAVQTAARKRAYQQRNRAMFAANNARRFAAQRKATPIWADPCAILAYYETAEALGMWTGEWHHVDHVVPLQSKRVCGLHCEANLQVIPGSDNQSKGNRRWPDMPTSH